MTLGKLILETARGDVKDRTVTPQELREIWEAIAAWCPIETAPKDGSHFLAIAVDDSSGFGWFGGEKVPAQTVVHWWGVEGEEGFYPSVSTKDGAWPFRATHWLPLQSAPRRGDDRGV